MSALPPLPYTFQANLSLYRKRLGVVRIIIAAGITLVLFYKYGLVFWLGSVVGLTILIVAILAVFARRSVTIHSDRLAYKTLFKTRTIHFEDIEGVKVFVNYYEASFGSFPRLTIGMKNNATSAKIIDPLTFVALYWRPEDMDMLIEVFKNKKITVEYYEDPVPYGVIAKQFPSYTSNIERHPIRIALITTAIVFVAIIVIVAVIISLGF